MEDLEGEQGSGSKSRGNTHLNPPITTILDKRATPPTVRLKSLFECFCLRERPAAMYQQKALVLAKCQSLGQLAQHLRDDKREDVGNEK